MTAPFIVINTYATKAGKLDNRIQFLRELFSTLEANEPRVLAFPRLGRGNRGS